MPDWTTDEELFALCRRELFTAVVGDICDQLGLRHQFLPPSIRPIHRGRSVTPMIGRAMTVLEADVFHEAHDGQPFGRMLEALDNLQAGEIYLCTGASPRYALVGELMCTALQVRGAAGIICDGYVRDTARLLEMPLPVYASGSYAQDQRGRGRVLDYRVPIEIEGVSIQSGDLLMGDIDGVLVVPRAAEEEVFTRALEKARAENVVREALLSGMSVSKAFATYGIL